MSTKRLKKSGVWEYMDKVADEKVQCRLCGRQLVYCKTRSTSSLINHLRSVHPDLADGRPYSSAKVQPSSTSPAAEPGQSRSSSRQEKISELLVNAASANTLPPSAIESQEFRELLLFLEPNYKIPCRKTMATWLEKTKSNVCSESFEVSMRKTRKL